MWYSVQIFEGQNFRGLASCKFPQNKKNLRIEEFHKLKIPISHAHLWQPHAQFLSLFTVTAAHFHI